MKFRMIVTAAVLGMMVSPIGAQAQGLINGARDGAREGDRAAGPVGAVVGGAVGAGVGTVNGALGIGPRHFYGRRCYYSHGVRHCRR